MLKLSSAILEKAFTEPVRFSTASQVLPYNLFLETHLSAATTVHYSLHKNVGFSCSKGKSFLEPYFFHLSGKVFSKCFLELQSYTCRLPEGAPSFSKHLLWKPELLAPRKALSLKKDFAGHCFPSILLNPGRQRAIPSWGGDL